ncbi:MAG: carboxypeptidase-like regulatory domain-containing protein, partial [Muribaculaceae bacterium]|nr:carboxypeptidase-like regulatory domain-containing protein [Muribaculaceae bacterium]
MNQYRRQTAAGSSKKLHLILAALLAILFPLQVFAQRGQVTGTVKDNTGEPLIGATIIEKGTATGTATDFDGNFVLFVNDLQKAVLVVSYVGYNTEEVAVKGQKHFDIVLKESSELLDELVVVGYGQQKKESVIGAIS